MTNLEVLSEFLSLPADAQSQVVSLIAFLKQKYTYAEQISPSLNVDLVNAPFIGMWRDRQDLGSTTWMRNLPESECLKAHN